MLKKFAVVFFLIVSLSFVHLYIISKTAMIGEEFGKNKKALEKLSSRNKDLEVRVAEKESLERIERIARNQLKMVTPEKINYIVIETKSPSEN